MSLALLPAAVQAAPFGVPAPRSALYLVASDDPLEDPEWRKEAGALKIATGVFAGLSAASVVSSIVVELKHPREYCYDECGPDQVVHPERNRPYDRALIGLGVLAGVSMLGLVIAGARYDHHLDRAALYEPIARTGDVRADLAWRARDRRLTRGMRATAALAAITGTSGWLFWRLVDGSDTGGPITAAITLTSISGINLLAFTALTLARANHRTGIARWPQLGAGGLLFRF